MKKKAGLFICFLFISVLLPSAEIEKGNFKSILLSPENESFSINKLIFYFEDIENRLSFAEISASEFDKKFKLSDKENLNFGMTLSAYWVRFDIKNLYPQIDDWLLEIEYPLLDSITFSYLDEDNRWVHQAFGDMYPFDQREWNARSFVIPLHLPDTITRTYYLKIKASGTMQFPMKISRIKSFHRSMMLSETYYGIFFGIMFLLIIYNIFIYFSLRDISYLYYVIFILSSTILLAFISGHIFQYLLKNSMLWCNKLYPSSIALTEFCIISFTRSFLNIKKYSPKLDKVLFYFQIFSVLLIFLLFFLDYYYSILVSIYTSQLYIICSLLSGIICYKRGNKAALLFILAFALYLLGGLSISLMGIGVIGKNIISRHGMEIGAMLNGVFLSLALINNYRISKIEKEKATEKIIQMRQKATLLLEQRVKERTTVIQDKNEELEQQKKKLQITLNNLKDTQIQLIQSEKMAALGGLVAGVAHEINTPIGISVTAASKLTEETAHMTELYKVNKITRSEFKDYLLISSESAKLILSNMERTVLMIQSFKQVSVDQSTSQLRKFKLKAYIQDIIRSLYPKLKNRGISITLEMDEHLELNSYPGAFSQIITNLVINSVTHGFEKMKGGTIMISSKLINEELQLKYSDSGRGMSKETLSRIFEPFFTTNKKLGTGLGMHIVYNLITQKFNGTIKCSSQINKGISVQIRIPISHQ